MSYRKILFINLIIFFLILLFLETSIFSYRKITGKIDLGYIKTGSFFNKIDDDCERMKSHPILGHVHDHKENCKIPDAVIKDNLVVYNYKNPDAKVIITLGGSTTDGFYKNFSAGKTYPYYLNKLCQAKGNCRVINAGAGGYGTTKELLKLLTEITPLNLNISHIISLNGINDIKNYSNPNLLESIKKPYLDSNQIYMLNKQKWIIKNEKPFYLFPNILSIFNDLELNLPKKKIINYSFSEQNLRFNDNTDVWLFNVKLMNEISNILNAKYTVFLQPTIGLEGVQSKISNIIGKDSEIVQNTIEDKEYIKNLRETYKKLKKNCGNLSFCIDISDIASPSSKNVYSNARHHNQKGNKIIALEIFEKLNFKNNFNKNIDTKY